jgi:hypothetical protein
MNGCNGADARNLSEFFAFIVASSVMAMCLTHRLV